MNENQVDEALLIKLYSEQRTSVDKLPYTSSFDKLVDGYLGRRPNLENPHHLLYTTLIRLRKSGRLPKRGRKNEEKEKKVEGHDG
jgi:hypothetical protein